MHRACLCLLLQLILLPLQADVHDTAVSRALNPINCLTAATSIAYLRWASKSLLPQVPGAPMDVAIAQVRILPGQCSSRVNTCDTSAAVETTMQLAVIGTDSCYSQHNTLPVPLWMGTLAC